MAYRNYFRSVLNDNFKILTWVLILFIAITPNFIFINSAHASAAEKWNYEPVMKDMNIHIKGYKVDQYGNAVNDYEYNTKIDPKTTANKQKMGTVGFGRLLKSSGWGLLGAAALEALLEAVDWVIDPEAQSIWRNKSEPDPIYGDCFGGKYLFRAQTAKWTTCPMETITKFWASQSGGGVTYKFERWQQSPEDVIKGKYNQILYTVTMKVSGADTKETPNQKLEYKPNPDYVPRPQEKEYLTPEALADYANKTHSDYAKPELAEKLNPMYSPKIAEDLWKPANQWEEENSPTVQEVQRKLDQAQPEPKKDAEIKPNPETGGSVLPKFCDWAAPVCDFIKWVKEQPENDDNTQIDVENLDETLIFDDSQRFSFGQSCPSPEQFSVSFFGTTQNLEFSYQPLCDFMSMIKPFVVAGSYLIGAYIVMGLSRGSGE